MMRFSQYISALRNMLASATLRIRPRQNIEAYRRAAATVLTMARRQGGLDGAVRVLAAAERSHREMTGGYLTAAKMRDGERGAFDALDLLAWLVIVERAEVPFVPAREILRLTQGEAELATGRISGREAEAAEKMAPATFRKLRAMATCEVSIATAGASAAAEQVSNDGSSDDLAERLAVAMDGVEDGWMVRYNRCGSSILKAIAGSGAAGPTAPEMTLSSTVGAGAGWIRTGNRRVVDLKDDRIVAAMASAPHGIEHVFVARPWIAARQYSPLILDPNRRGTFAAGPGSWPREWRAFVLDGKVTGLSGYYSWSSPQVPTLDDIRMICAVRTASEAIVATAVASGLRPGCWTVDSLVERPADRWRLKDYAAMCPPGGFNCCLDFLETDAGPVFLEAGPPVTWLGAASGAHPVGFIVTLDRVAVEAFPKPFGVVIGTPPDLEISDLHAAVATSTSGIVYTWDEIWDHAADLMVAEDDSGDGPVTEDEAVTP